MKLKSQKAGARGWFSKKKKKYKNIKAAKKDTEKRTARATKSIKDLEKTLDYFEKFKEGLYHGTSTVFQEEIIRNGIMAPSQWGDYGLAEANAYKMVEKHGGEPAVIQIPLSEFKKEHFLLDESNEDIIVYTEDFHLFMEKQQQKLL